MIEQTRLYGTHIRRLGRRLVDVASDLPGMRNPLIRYAAIAIAAVVTMLAAVVPVASVIVEGWSQRDVELRSRLVFRSVRDQVIVGLAAKPAFELAPFFERLSEDERILGLAFCDDRGVLMHTTRAHPKSVDCKSVPLRKVDTFATIPDAERRIQVSTFPLTSGGVSGHLLVMHDLTYVDERAREARLYSILAVVGVAIGLSFMATAIVLGLMRTWTRHLRRAILDAQRTGQAGEPTASNRKTTPFISKEVHSALAAMRLERRFADPIHIEWSPKTLRRLLVEELPGSQVIVVSNREPYIHNRTGSDVSVQTPASGLVAALEPVMRACGGTWIAHGSGTADRETVDAHDRVRVPPETPLYTLRRVWLSDEEQDGYYYGFANEGLWPLCHVAFVRPTFREPDWSTYRAVNERFADVVAQEATCDDPVVLVQDYHFALLPRMIRARLPKATIVTFWHIPWPNAETFGICPWREEIIDGLLGSTILGFHTQFHCNNFLEAADRFMESRIDREHASVAHGGHETLIRPYPISIEWPPAAMTDQAPVRECRDLVQRRYGLGAELKLIVGIERFDYTKGILDRIRAIDDLLSRHAEWRRRLVLIQVAAPTRSKLGAYCVLQQEAKRLADEVNVRHADGDWQPIRLVIRHHEPPEVYELFRSADVCIVSSLHDGMNLVAKEFVAARDDEQGVLVLSSFAGASRELSEAVIVNPYDTHGMAEALDRALQVSRGEQRERMRLMRDQVRQRNVYRWAAQMLLDSAQLRRRAGLDAI